MYVKVMKYSTSRYFVGVKYVLDGIQTNSSILQYYAFEVGKVDNLAILT